MVPSFAELLAATKNGQGRGAVGQGEADGGGGARAGGRVCFAEEERLFSYGR